ncbi:TM2 domain-containing protein [Cellulomonas sp. H30R-01]|uniref:TM2 domain-containing protein n=1 Tax=Cellulomonas sp. H30R-01 TaxID=2704467 RepID=UPI00138D855D|nr:TM2 domain-containing protein [Cellulomonas sp. H30R-01]QHT57001.1 TM2 domain-containing protein [Cellulomonas sp. H30R-01]
MSTTPPEGTGPAEPVDPTSTPAHDLSKPQPPAAPPAPAYGSPAYGAPGYGAQPAYGAPAESSKSFVATWLLAWFLGVLGVDRFYLGKVGTGILKLVTCGGLGIWALVDLILTLAGVQRDKAGLPLAGYQQHKKLAWIITAIGFVIGLFGSAANQATIVDQLDTSSAVVVVVQDAAL